MFETILIAISLSMDAFAVSVSTAACSKNLKRLHIVRAAGAFGLFQFLMPLAGWFLGSTFNQLIGSFDHWIAFALLTIVGGKMLVEVYEEWKKEPNTAACPTDAKEKLDISSKRIVLVLAVATSIDALAVGIGFSVIGIHAIKPSLVIGTVTFILCLLGFFFGKRIGLVFGRYAQISGGLVLMGIGARILFSHVSTGV